MHAILVDSLTAADESPRLSPGTVGWLVAVGALPLVELGVMSASFDASLAQRAGVLAHVIGASGDLARAALPVFAAAVLLGVARLHALVPALRAAFADARRPWAALVGHLACFGVVLALSRAVFVEPDPGAAVLAAWIATGLAGGVLWVLALIPGIARRGPGWVIGGILLAGGALGLVAASAASVTREWWQPLGRFTVWTVYGLLRALGFDAGAEVERFYVGTPTFVVEISPYCSGYQGIGLMWAFLGAYLCLFRDRVRFPRALWLLPLGTVLVWVLNALRITVLVIIGSYGFQEIAMQGFHYHAGTLLFCAAALGLGAWAGSSRAFGTRTAGTVRTANPSAAYLLPLLALLLTALLTGSATSGAFDPLYGLRVVVTGAVLWAFRGPLRAAGWRMSWEGALLGVAAFAVWIALAPGAEGSGDLGAALAGLDPATRALWLALRFAGAVVAVPVVEELAFRGYLARRLTAVDFETVSPRAISWPALLASSALFGLMHRDILAGAAVGVLYGLAARRRGQLGDAVLAHAVTNALLAIAVLATGRWALWQ